MSLTIISWCQGVHDVPFSVNPYTGQILVSPWHCDPRRWYGEDHRSQAGLVWQFHSTNKPMCMPRWALWGYQDRSSVGWSNRFWMGPGIDTLPNPGQVNVSLVYTYAGANILTVNGSMVYLGNNLPSYPGHDWVNFATNIGVPPKWVASLRMGTVTGPPKYNYGNYTVWDLPDELIVRDPVITGGGPEGPQAGPIYGFAYDGPIDRDSQGNLLTTQTVTLTVNGQNLNSLYRSDPSVPLYFYVKPPRS